MIYFFPQFSVKKKCFKNFFSIIQQFLMHFLIPSSTNFITNKKYVWRGAKNQGNICWFLKIPARGNFLKLVEISKKKIVLFFSNFRAPNAVRSSRIWSVLLHWMQNFMNLHKIIKICFWMIFIIAFFTVQQPEKEDSFRYMLKSSASMYESSGLHLIRITMETQSGLDPSDKLRLPITSITIIGVTLILYVFR